MFPTLLPHSSRHRLLLTALLLILVALGAFQLRSSLAAAVGPPGGSLPGTVVAGSSYNNDTSPPLREMPQLPLRMQPEREANRNPAVALRHQNEPDGSAVQNLLAPLAMPTPILSFDGIAYPGVGCSCAPPDTNGEVGATQYVQIVNKGYQVFNKTTGASVLGPSAISSIWAGFGGVCQNNGSGDPVVLYDQLANRWLISQFAGTSVPTDECIAVSTSSDATGSYNRYGFHLGNNFFDYPHLGVWPDAYYMSMNVFNAAGSAFLGPQPFAFDRTRMLAGLSATFVSTGITGGPNESVALPADLDGSNLPTAGAPATFVEFPDTGAYRTFHFHVDFTTPANSTFTLFASPAAAAFTGLCGFGATRACVPQLGSPDNLDGIGDRLMFRLAYRKFTDGHEAVVGNYSVAASNGGVAAPRWFELRNVTAGPVTVFQESTYQPDATSRWMGSAAMDGAGNMALGFSASSTTSFPQVRYAGRLATDPLNTLAQGEATLFAGTGSQLQTGNRWGDYSDMTVDPTDDSTFWYTQEYYAATATYAWRTRIGNFKFPVVGTPTLTPTGTPPTVTATATAIATATATATAVVCPPQTYSNSALITINDAAPASPYPSNITVAGAGSSLTNISVALNGMNHTFPDDIDMLLVGPNGGNVLLMSDAGGSGDLVGVNLVFQDGSPLLPNSAQITSGTYGPTNYGAGDTFAAPAPAGPYGTSLLTAFAGSNPNGTWSLYIMDDSAGDFGTVTGGWSLTLTTSAPCGTATATAVASTSTATTTQTSVANTATATATGILPTITLTIPPTLSATRTATAVTNTATATSILPTVTLTVVPPTATSTATPPANTATATSVLPTVTLTIAVPTVTLTVVPPTVTQTQTPPANTATATATTVANTATVTVVANTATATATATACPGSTQTFTGIIGPADPSHLHYVDTNGAASTCALPHAYPGTAGNAPFNYDTYTVSNSSPNPQCITVLVNGSACGPNSDGVQVELYQGSFNPNDLAANYLGDSGGGAVTGSRTLSVTVPANTVLVIVVDEYTNTRGCASYTLTVSGLPCATGTATATTVPGSTNTVTRTPAATGTAVATATPCPIHFTDVTDPTAYYYQGVYYLACHGVISGYSDGTYKPFNNTTRAQMTKIVTLAFNLPLVTPPATGTFADVDSTSVFYQLIETAASRGIVSGYTCGGINPQTGAAEPCDSAHRGYFRPSNFVTRGQLAKIVVLGAAFPLINPAVPSFTDVAPSNVFYQSIETAVCHGTITGYDDHTFRPNNYAFRGQIAKIVYLAVINPRDICVPGAAIR